MKKIIFTCLSIFLLTPAVCSQTSDTYQAPQKNKNDVRITIGGGYAYRLGKIERSGIDKLDDFMSDLRKGYSFDMEVQSYIEKHWGIGANAIFALQTKKANKLFSFPGSGTVDHYRQTHALLYMGPSFVARIEGKRAGVYMGAGIGGIYYYAEGLVRTGSNSDKTDTNKFAFGSHLSVSGEYRISRKTGIGLKTSILTGHVKTHDFETSDKKKNLTNLLVTAFISFRN